MSKSNKFSLLLLTIIILSACAPAEVVETAVEGPIPCSTNALISAINTANADTSPDIIELNEGCTYELTSINNLTGEDGGNGLPAIESPITITGSSTIIARAASPSTPYFRIFLITNTGQLSVEGVEVRNGATTNGAGFFVAGGGLTLNNSLVTGNIAANFGGAIYNQGSVFVEEFSALDGNAAISGAGIYNDNGSIVLEDSNLTRNIATDIGGGVFNSGNDADLEYVLILEHLLRYALNILLLHLNLNPSL